MINSLTGRLLALTIIFVMVAEVLILLPSISRFRQEYLQERVDRSQLAALVFLASNEDMLDPELEQELLEGAGVLNIILRRSGIRELVLAEPMPMTGNVAETFDLTGASRLKMMQDALSILFRTEDRMIRLLGKPQGGDKLEVTLLETPLREEIVDFATRIIWLSLLISAITAGLLFFAIRSLIVKPIRGVVDSMVDYQDDPEDARRIIEPNASVVELRAAETALNELQSELTRNLRQKDRLASLGIAVSKVSHDLRNMLTTVQLLADRMENSEDPTVQRVAPKLIGSVDRAISLCEQTLKFGKAEEEAPKLAHTRLAGIVQDIKDAEELREDATGIELVTDFDGDFEIFADSEQIFRAINNLVRNARQAIAASGRSGTITVTAVSSPRDKQIEISDSGPGLPQKARDKLFTPFHGGTRRGGSGLGLAIASELVRGHGGTLELINSSCKGTRFRITLPHPNLTGK